MVISSYKYVVGTEKVNGNMQIPELDRGAYMTTEYLRMFKEYISTLKLEGRCALLIAGGPASHHSESRVIDNQYTAGSVVIKSQLGYSTYVIAKALGVMFDYININTNTCASSMHCIDEAFSLINYKNYDHVVVVAFEETEESQLKLFEQLGIELMCGDGAGIAVFSNDRSLGDVEVTSTAFTWKLEAHPMFVSTDGYVMLMSMLDCEGVNKVKTHGTGTGVNEAAEKAAIVSKLCGTVEIIGYKNIIGHTQGASGLIELLMLSNSISSGDKVVALASGLGGFYGGCTVIKK